MHLQDLKQQSSDDLAKSAADLGIDGARSMRRQDLVFAILRALGSRREEIHAEGVLEVLPDGFGFLRAADQSYLPGPDDVYVSPSQIRRFSLRTGDVVSGLIRAPKESERYFALLKVEGIGGSEPERRTNYFEDLTSIHPAERLRLEVQGDDVTARALDLFCPLGKGQRCLIAAPPSSGVTTLLTTMARALAKNHPELGLITLLVDERPEVVSEFRALGVGEVGASTFEEAASRHVQVAEIAIERAKRRAEAGEDVVVFIDSLTGLARAYDQVVPASAKILPSGIDPAALHKVRRFFAAGRNFEEGGSLTMIAVARRGTESAIDRAVLEDLETTETARIELSEELSSAGMYPALDLRATRARRPELLLGAETTARIDSLRRVLGAMSLGEAITELKSRLAQSSSNDVLLEGLNER